MHSYKFWPHVHVLARCDFGVAVSPAPRGGEWVADDAILDVPTDEVVERVSTPFRKLEPHAFLRVEFVHVLGGKHHRFQEVVNGARAWGARTRPQRRFVNGRNEFGVHPDDFRREALLTGT